MEILLLRFWITVESYLFEGQCSWLSKLAGSGGRNFVGKWFEGLQCKAIHYFV